MSRIPGYVSMFGGGCFSIFFGLLSLVISLSGEVAREVAICGL
jgi:hypothetical protein